jgi:hypothetical protein
MRRSVCFLEVARDSNHGVTTSRHGVQRSWELETRGWMLEKEAVDAES